MAADPTPLVRELERRPASTTGAGSTCSGRSRPSRRPRPAPGVDRESVLAEGGGRGRQGARGVRRRGARRTPTGSAPSSTASPSTAGCSTAWPGWPRLPVVDVGTGPGPRGRVPRRRRGRGHRHRPVARDGRRGPATLSRPDLLDRRPHQPAPAARGRGWGAITAWYALVHLAGSELAPAVASLTRVLVPGGWLALASRRRRGTARGRAVGTARRRRLRAARPRPTCSPLCAAAGLVDSSGTCGSATSVPRWRPSGSTCSAGAGRRRRSRAGAASPALAPRRGSRARR